jgi:hemoglobin/transferrin/lactoferrin receptor protein
MALKKIGVAAACLWLAGTDTAAFAQESAPTNDGAQTQTNGAEPAADAATAAPLAPVVLPPISVSATRNPIKAFDYPGMVTVIDADRPDLRNSSTPDDLLNRVPNVEFMGGPRRTGEVPSIRGFSGPDVIITIDGARQNLDTGHEGRFFIDPSIVKEVEVLRGAASALYGSGGTGGLIAFRTLSADDLLDEGEVAGFRIGGGYQSASHEPFGTFTAYGKPGESIDLLGSVTRRNSGDIDLARDFELDSEDEVLAALVKAGIDLNEHNRLEASFQHFDNEADEPLNGQGIGGEDETEKDIRNDTTRLTYSYQNPDDKLLDLDLTLYYTDFQVDALRLDDLGAGPEGEKLKRSVDTLGFRLENSSRAEIGDGMGLTFTYGAEGYRDKQDGESGSGDRDGVPDAEADFVGGFAQVQLNVEEPFGFIPGEVLLLGGVRYDHYSADSSVSNGTTDDAVSPRVGLSYMPTDWSLLFANYGEAFRAPTINEMFLEGVHFEIPIGPGIVNRFVSNPDLKPQTTETVEVGGGLDFTDVATPGDRLTVKGSYFWIWGKDFINLSVNQPAPFVDCNPFIPGDCDGTTTSDNVADAKLWGGEVEASYENQRVRFGFGFSDINGIDRETGDHLGALSPAQFTIDAAVKIYEIDTIIGWRVLIGDDFDKTEDPLEERKGYDVHDFYISWAPTDTVIEGLRVDFGVTNAFDELYARTFTDSFEEGRSFNAAVSYQMNF